MDEFRVAVVGAGVVGLATAHHLLQQGAKVTIIDRDPDGDKASYGNAGGIAVTEIVPAAAPSGIFFRALGWMLDPLGPLAVRPSHALKLLPWLVGFAKASAPSEVARISRALAAINSRVYDDLLPMLEEAGLAAELHRNGALAVYETEQGYRRDAAEWASKRAHGIAFEELTGAQARTLEPALGPSVQHAVLLPQWSHYGDPARLVRGLREYLRKRGVAIEVGEVRRVVAGNTPPVSLLLDGGKTVTADRAVIATGAWSGILARSLGDRVLLESERGYNMTLPAPGITVQRELIFAERKFVASPLTCGLRIGGAAEFGGLQAAANFKRSAALVKLASRYLPDLRTEGATSWAGHRPTTPDSLPVIGSSPANPNVFYAFGHGHLGLTQAATTGKLLAELMFGQQPSIDLAPFSITRFS